MKLKTVKYEYSKISIDKSNEQIQFKKEIDIRNVIYFFFKDDKCLYIGETGATLKERCYKNTPKHSEKDWFKSANTIYIMQLDMEIGDIARQTLESTFILAYRPVNNKKA